MKRLCHILLCRLGRDFARLARDRAGTVAVMVGLMSTSLVGVVGLSVDVGDWYFTRRSMQSAADAAAIGGGVELMNGSSSSTVISAATSDAELTGFSSANGTTVDVSVSGDYVNVTLEKPASLLFSGLFLSTAPTITVTSQAGLVTGTQPVCALMTGSSAPNALYVSGNGIISATGCSLVVDSTSTSAINVAGNGQIDSEELCSPGGYTSSGNAKFSPKPTSCAAMTDPLASMTPPSNVNNACQYTNASYGGNSITSISPGVYCGGITIQANAKVTFLPGVYILRNGGFTAGSNAVVTGAGVGIYMTGTGTTVQLSQDDLSVGGNALVTITAPITGSMAGIALYQDHSAPTGDINNTISGNGDVNFTGLLYFGNQNVTITGNGIEDGTAPFTSIIANTLTYSGNAKLEFNSSYSNTTVPPVAGMDLPRVALTQ